MGFGKQDVENAVKKLEGLLNAAVSPDLQDRYESGREMYSLSYDKLQKSTGLPILTRYIIAARSYVHQPCAYYDIFRACRATIYVQLLAAAVEYLTLAGVEGLSERLERLKSATDYDVFDSGLLELVAAWRYAVDLPNSKITFIQETGPGQKPDFSYRFFGVDCLCECKKINRSDSHTVRMRNAARDCLNAVVTALRDKRLSVSAEIIFHDDPGDVSTTTVHDAVRDALSNATPILEKSFTVNARHLPSYSSDSYVLYPSPGFYWERYGYRHRGDWFGVVNQLAGEFVQPNGDALNDAVPMSTWVSEIWWDAAIKWKVSKPEIVAKYQRFAFDNVFGALSQIEANPINSTAHIWVESDYYLQGRSTALRDLFERIERNARDLFGWLIINETLLDISPKGFFDIIEHSHIIEGPTAVSSKPPVTVILTQQSGDPVHTGGAFGVGTSLPDIDE